MRTLLLAGGIPLLLAGCAAASGGAAPDLYARLDAASGVLSVDGQQQATAFLVSADGEVLTAAHATAGTAPLAWESPTLGRLPLERVAADPAHDLALLRLRPPGSGKTYPWLRLAASDPPPGTLLFGFGNPMFRRRLLVSGIVGESSTSFEYLPDLALFTECRHLGGSTIPGMSGGPWVDARGDVVGVQSGGISLNGAMHGVCWAGPRAELARLVAAQRSPEVADLGCVVDSLYELGPQERKRFPAEASGALVRRLHDGSPLDAAGIPSGSLIEAVDGAALQDRDGLLRAVRAVAPGAEVTLRVRAPDGPARDCKVRTGRLVPFAKPGFAPVP
jgi:S1-C subfamily serine protease